MRQVTNSIPSPWNAAQLTLMLACVIVAIWLMAPRIGIPDFGFGEAAQKLPQLSASSRVSVTVRRGDRVLRLSAPARVAVGTTVAVGVLPPSGLQVQALRATAPALTTAPVRCYEVTALLGRRETTAGASRCLGPGPGAAMIKWAAAPGASGYRVYRGGLGRRMRLIGQTRSTSFADRGLPMLGGGPPQRNKALFLAKVVAAAATALTIDRGAPLAATKALVIPDDAPVLQSAINEALSHRQSLLLTQTDYNLFSTVTIAPPPGSSSALGVTIVGSGPGNTVLHWYGPSNKSVLQFAGAKNGEVKGFSITGNPALADLDFRGAGSSSNMRLEDLLMDNPAVFSVRAGNPADKTEVSEYTLLQVNSFNATVAGFEIEGANSLNFNFYSCGCSHEPVCVSNDGSRDPTPGGQVGGNFNWFGGSISDTPLGRSSTRNAAFVLAAAVPYNFTGVRVEDTATLFYTPASNAPLQINWIGGLFINEQAANSGAPILVYQAGGGFESIKSSWGANGSFKFGPNTRAAVFDDDLMAVAKNRPDANASFKDYFAGLPSGTPLRLANTGGFPTGP